jgi:hypothetical protein
MRIDEFDQPHEAGIDADLIEESVERGIVNADEGEFALKALARADLTGLPELLDFKPRRIDGVFFDEIVEHIAAGDGAIEIDPNRHLGRWPDGDDAGGGVCWLLIHSQ